MLLPINRLIGATEVSVRPVPEQDSSFFYYSSTIIIIDVIKGAVYTVWIFICICMSLRVFLFAKKRKFLTKGGIHCISQVFPWHFYFMREHSLVELTEHDDSAANIIVHSMYTYVYCCIHSTY